MSSTIITKNSSTASAVPSAGSLVQGELAVNVTDKKLYTKDNSATVVKVVGSLGNQEANAVAITGGTVAGVAQTGGTINNTPVGATTASTVRGTVVTATTNFSGPLTGAVTGNVTGNLTGNVTGNVTGNLTGNVTAASGTSTFNHVTISGSLDMDAGTSATITGLATPVNNTDAATKIYVDTAISNLVDGAPANLDTLNEIAAALNDDANIATTLTNSIATKVSKAGDSMTGALAMGTNKITGLGTPTAGTDATTKTYVDTADALKLNLAGGTMSGAIAMGSNKITGLGTPTADADATTKVYVDGILGSATSAAASASAAATSATNAANSASAASTSASNASASASSAAATYDEFDDRYLGSKASAPTVDNDGNALLTGALYWNSASSNLFVWTGSAWTNAAFTAGGFATLIGTETLTNKTIEFVDGTAAAPSITNVGDTNTGIFFPSADSIAFAEGGAEVARITDTGAWSFGASGTSTGTNGQVLTSSGSASAPAWTTLASSQWTTSGSNIYYTAGKVFINTTTGSDSRLCVDQDIDTNPFRGIIVRSADAKKFMGAFGVNSTGALAISQSWDGPGGSYQPIVFNTGGAAKLSINASSGAIALQDAATTANGVGITFPTTQSASSDANTLDDYEEGTWTPVDSSGAGLSFSSAGGFYTKIGRQVICFFYVTFPSTANGSAVAIGGLPFTTGNNVAGGVFTGAVAYNTYGSMQLVGPSSVTFFNLGTPTGSDITNANMSSKVLRGSFLYFVA